MNMTQSAVVKGARPRRAGFTLLELLIVVAVVGIFAALLMPIHHGGQRSVKVACLSRIKMLNLALYTYAQENRDRLPQMQPSNLAWDMPVAVVGSLLTNGLIEKNFYDPGFPEMRTLWNVGTNASLPYRTIGYALTFPGTAGLIQSNENRTTVPQPIVITNPILPKPDPSRRVLIAGATISVSGERNVTNRTANHYTGISVGSFNARSAHLDTSGKIPTGDNVAMLDGSGMWRKLTNMAPRTTGSGPVFWW